MMKFQTSIFSLVQICHVFIVFPLFIFILFKVPTIQGKILGSSKLLTMPSSNIAIVFADSTLPLINKLSERPFLNSVDQQLTFMKSLKRFTEESQAPFLALLSLFEPLISIQPMWAINVIFVRGATPAVIIALLNHPFVFKLAQIREQILISLPKLQATVQETAPTVENPAWGVTMVKAPQSWTAHGNGNGSKVATIDTGCNRNHEALKDNYIGDENSGWFDPVSLFPTNTPEDKQGHGSHCMGSICGAHGTGVAPGAKWISTVGCGRLFCKEDDLTACGQWLVSCNNGEDELKGCPNKPDVISCSWGGSDSNSNGTKFYDGIIAGWISLGIVPVFANGNSGPACGSVGYPASNPQVCSVGSTNKTDQVSSFSSRGQTLKGEMAPKCCAPGETITSCDKKGNGYVIMSGTSMSTPHVAGCASLIKAACPKAKPVDIISALMKSANTEVGGKTGTCNKDLGTECGAGRVDVLAAQIFLQNSGVCK